MHPFWKQFLKRSLVLSLIGAVMGVIFGIFVMIEPRLIIILPYLPPLILILFMVAFAEFVLSLPSRRI